MRGLPPTTLVTYHPSSLTLTPRGQSILRVYARGDGIWSVVVCTREVVGGCDSGRGSMQVHR